MTARIRVFRQFILNAPLPPHYGSDDGGNERYEHQNKPSQPAQSLFVEAEGKRLLYLWRNTDKLFSTKQPVYTTRNEIEPLLILCYGIVLNEACIANYYQARRIHLDPLISAATFFSCCADYYRRITLLRVGL